jgi:outer membrane protein assembly factor BamB
VVSGGRIYVYASDGTLAALTVGAAPGGSRGTSNQPAEAGDRASIPEDGGTAAPGYPSAPPPP